MLLNVFDCALVPQKGFVNILPWAPHIAHVRVLDELCYSLAKMTIGHQLLYHLLSSIFERYFNGGFPQDKAFFTSSFLKGKYFNLQIIIANFILNDVLLLQFEILCIYMCKSEDKTVSREMYQGEASS